MRKTPKIYTILIIVFLGIAQLATAATPKNFLQTQWTLEDVKKMLVTDQKWIQFPTYSDRQGWDQLFGQYKEKIIRSGENYLDYEWKIIKATDYLAYQRTGDRLIMEDPYFANLHAISSLLMAEMAEGKGRFMDPLINGIFHFCEMSSWALSAHLVVQPSHRPFPSHEFNYIDIFTGDVSNMLSLTYYLLHTEFDKIEPEISHRLYYELNRRILTPYLKNHFWWMSAGSNWNAWTNYNMILTFMLLENDKDRLAKGIYKTMKSIDNFFNYVHEDGACEEGPHYWSWAHAKAFAYLELLKKITGGGINLLNEPKIKRMGEYIVHNSIGNRWVVNFADASAKGDYNPLVIYQFGKATNSNLMQHFAANEIKSNQPITFDIKDVYGILKCLKIQKEIEKADTIYHLEPLIWYPQNELCYLRNEKVLLAAKGGHNNEVHNHNDVGSFVFATNHTPIFIDAGNGTYNAKTFSDERYSIWNMSSLYHNVPVINGFAQKYGSQYKAENAKAEHQRFQLDIAHAYPKEAKVKNWIRSYELKKKELIIKDKFSLVEALAPNQINFLTRGDVSIQEGKIHIVVAGVKVTLSYDHSLFKTLLEPITLEDPKLSEVWGKHIYRISFISTKLEKTGTYTFKIKY